jgi:hypothetical protein
MLYLNKNSLRKNPSIALVKLPRIHAKTFTTRDANQEQVIDISLEEILIDKHSESYRVKYSLGRYFRAFR